MSDHAVPAHTARQPCPLCSMTFPGMHSMVYDNAAVATAAGALSFAYFTPILPLAGCFSCIVPSFSSAAVQFLRLLRLAKLARVVRVQRFFRRWENALSINYSTLKLCFFVAFTLVIAHWIACGLFLITSFEPRMVRQPLHHGQIKGSACLELIAEPLRSGVTVAHLALTITLTCRIPSLQVASCSR